MLGVDWLNLPKSLKGVRFFQAELWKKLEHNKVKWMIKFVRK